MEHQRQENIGYLTKGDKCETLKQALIEKGDNDVKETGYGTLETRKWRLIN